VEQLNTILWNLIFEDFSKNFRENSSFIQLWQEQPVRYVKTFTFKTIARSVLIRMRSFSDEICRGNQNKQNRYFFLETLPFIRQCIKFCKAGQTIEGNTIWRMRFACWMTKAKDTNSEYVTLIAFPLQQWLNECASMLRNTYTAYLASLNALTMSLQAVPMAVTIYNTLCTQSGIKSSTYRKSCLAPSSEEKSSLPWRRKYHFPSKRWQIYRLHAVTGTITVFFSTEF
jgi:hypothetical protein